ncbi:hypothetical protein HG530_008239 [Fusarium avenaceum]|nr:hypothetical protein HG530_008239 [Fusarium avenaceum]
MAAQGTAISLRAVSDDAASVIAIVGVEARWITRYTHSLTNRSILSSIIGNDGSDVGVPFSPYRVNGLKIADRAANNRVQLLNELLELLINELVDLLGELLGLGANLLSTRSQLIGDDTNLLLNGMLKLLNRGRGRSSLGLVATSLNDLLVVAAATTVPGKLVGGVGGNVGEDILGGNGDQVLLELLGGDGSESVLGVLSGLKREVVGQKTSNVGRGHRSTGDGVDGVLGADPGRLNVQTGGKDVSALSVVREVGTAIIESRGTDSDGLGGGSGGVVASISVVVASGNSKVNTGANGSVDSGIESLGLATTERHVGDRALEALALAVLSLLLLLKMAGGRELDTLDDIGHGSGAVRSKDLDSIDAGLLGNTVLLAGNSTGAVSTVTIAILIGIARGNGLTPVSTALEIDVVDVGTSVNNVGINTLTTIGGVEVLVECTEVEGAAVGDTGKTPRSLLLGISVALVLCDHVLVGNRNHGVNEGVSLNELDLYENLDLLVGVLNPHVMIVGSSAIDVVLELDDVRVWDGLGIDGAEDGGSLVVDGADAEGGSAGDSGHGQSEDGLHGEEARKKTKRRS